METRPVISFSSGLFDPIQRSATRELVEKGFLNIAAPGTFHTSGPSERIYIKPETVPDVELARAYARCFGRLQTRLIAPKIFGPNADSVLAKVFQSKSAPVKAA